MPLHEGGCVMKKDIKKLQNGVATLEWQPSGVHKNWKVTLDLKTSDKMEVCFYNHDEGMRKLQSIPYTIR